MTFRSLIAQMACENFLWDAPRIHGEPLMLGFTVSQATVIALPASTKQKANTVVADPSSQSNRRLHSQPKSRAAFRHGVLGPVELFLLGQAHEICGADCEDKRSPLSLAC